MTVTELPLSLNGRTGCKTIMPAGKTSHKTAGSSPKSLIPIYHSTQCHILEDITHIFILYVYSFSCNSYWLHFYPVHCLNSTFPDIFAVYSSCYHSPSFVTFRMLMTCAFDRVYLSNSTWEDGAHSLQLLSQERIACFLDLLHHSATG